MIVVFPNLLVGIMDGYYVELFRPYEVFISYWKFYLFLKEINNNDKLSTIISNIIKSEYVRI